MANVTIRGLRAGERRQAAVALACAFSRDPVMRFISGRAERDESLWNAVLRFEHSGNSLVDLAWDGKKVVGVGVWDPPGHRQFFASRLMAVPHFVRILGPDGRKGAQVETWFRQQRPHEPFWYLACLGAVERGLGIGSALLGHRLTTIDASDCSTTYLESSNVQNLPLYERFGFVSGGELAGSPHGAPPVWGMLRRT